jgi:hypothetical protein
MRNDVRLDLEFIHQVQRETCSSVFQIFLLWGPNELIISFEFVLCRQI